ncbi:MAG: cation-translocating P-type ATPase [Hydrogenophaga sp.]|uniref:heavy metal translocating P-type ATPase n=1 Tax=Hydrogenophaga sp. TaxID=1904254 RepID=UPI002735D01B|nr:cation-translocating P-type ATPase [Hydrogenophaga sp.]MDP3628335.1 cation-translocating P-type ATPase [Hydrogenophaga sp.]
MQSASLAVPAQLLPTSGGRQPVSGEALHPSSPPPAEVGQLLDDPAAWSAFSRPVDERAGCWESHLVIEGMHCAACALTIEEALRSVPGVASASVSAGSRRASVRWQADAVLPSGWMEAVRHAGYRAVPANDAFASERRRQETRKALWRWLVAGLCMMQVMMYAWPAYVAEPGDLSAEMEQLLRWASWVLTLPVMLFSCGPFFSAAWRDVLQRRVSMDLPVALGMGITFVVSTAGTFEPQGIFGKEVYFDSLTMFVFFLLTGRWLEQRLRERTAGALDALMNRLPDSVLRQRADGEFERVAVRRVQPGDVLRVLPGEAFPADGTVIEGETLADEALLTGESRALPRGVGAAVIAGSHNLNAAVLVRVERTGADTRFAQIVALMEQAATSRPQLAQLVDRMARPFLIGVLLAAGGAAAFWWSHDPGHALMVAVAVLVVTCPCALSLATPAAMLAAAGTLARQGVLVRRLGGLEALAQVDTVLFDKTGTLTRDAMTLQSVSTREGVARAEALAMAMALAQQSLHPVSRALVAAGQGEGVLAWRSEQVQERAGQGLLGQVSPPPGRGDVPRELRLGSRTHCGVSVAAPDGPHAVLSDAQGWLATFELGEDIRPDAAATVAALQAEGIDVRILSGDAEPAVVRVAAQLGLRDARGGCTPQDKLAFLQAAQGQGRRVAVVGDGLNDGPALAGAHVSFAFGQAVPLAQAQSDFVVLGEQLAAVGRSLLLARRTQRIVRQNLAWALVYNAACVPLAVAGWLPAWLAGLGMAASSLLVVLNALRLAVEPSHKEIL